MIIILVFMLESFRVEQVSRLNQRKDEGHQHLHLHGRYLQLHRHLDDDLDPFSDSDN